MALGYLHLRPGQALPTIGRGSSFKAVVVIESEVSEEWQTRVCDWLVQSGCLYMMAWGKDCSSWDDGVDWAMLAQFDCGEIPDDAFVMTTWHDEESLSATFGFARYCASHPTVASERVIILHIADEQREKELLAMYQAASE